MRRSIAVTLLLLSLAGLASPAIAGRDQDRDAARRHALRRAAVRDAAREHHRRAHLARRAAIRLETRRRGEPEARRVAVRSNEVRD